MATAGFQDQNLPRSRKLARKIRDNFLDRFATLQSLPHKRACRVELRYLPSIDIQDGSADLINYGLEVRIFHCHCGFSRIPANRETSAVE